MRHCPYVHKQKRWHFHAKTTVQWRSTYGAWHILLDSALPYTAVAVIFLIKSILLVILGHFFKFSPDHLLDICLGDNRSLAISILCFIFQNIGILSLTIMKKRENGHYIHQNGHVWYCVAIFVARTFQALPKRNWCLTDALISTVWKNGDCFIALKSPNN